MDFAELLGNRRLKENLRASIGRGHISHFYLICGPVGSGKKTLAKLLSAAILCRDSRKPCMQCTACRKVLADAHPDLITVTDPEHKTVAVKIVREIREDLFVRPNESDKKIYLFPQELGTEGQNALLKVLEEPPAYGVFILLSENPETLLPTVRSRCTELALQALPEDILRQWLQAEYPQAGTEAVSGAIFRSGGYLGQAKRLLEEGTDLPEQTAEFLRSMTAADALGITQVLVGMEKNKRDQLTATLNQWLQLLQQALATRSGAPAASPFVRELALRRSPRDLNRYIGCLQKAIAYAQGNVASAAICGWLAWALR